MRVIRPAEPGKWEREDACSVCGTRAGLGVDDLATLDDQREGRRFCWTCPTCNAREWIDGDAIPRVLHVFIKTWVP